MINFTLRETKAHEQHLSENFKNTDKIFVCQRIFRFLQIFDITGLIMLMYIMRQNPATKIYIYFYLFM